MAEHRAIARRPGGGVTTGGFDPTGHPLPPVFEPPQPPIPPLDPDEVAQIELLNEAVLRTFAADANPAAPFASNTLRWDIAMPTTVLPGVSVEVRMAVLAANTSTPGFIDDLAPAGTLPAAQRSATTYAISLIAPKASRVLGEVTVEVDLSHLRSFVLDTTLVTVPVRNQVTAGFPPGGTISLRTPPVVGVHLEAYTVDLALAVDGPAFFNPDASVSLSWTVSGRGPAPGDVFAADAQIVSAISTASTNVDIGALSSVTSLGVANIVAAAVEAVSDGYLLQLVGPLIAEQTARGLTDTMNAQRPPNFVFHHLDVTPDAFTFWYCPRPS